MVTTSRDRSLVASALWRRRWLIIIATVLGGLIGFQASQLQEETYEAESRLVLSATYPFDPLGGTSGANASRYLANQREVIQSGDVLELAADELPPGNDAEVLAESLDVTTLADSDIIVVIARAPTAELAAARADSVAVGYQRFVAGRVTEAADAAAQVVAGDPTAVADIRTEAAVYGDGVAVVENAAVPSSPIAPVPRRDALIMGLLSAIVASGFALWRRDQQPLDPQEVAADAEAPLLGVVDVPMHRGRVTAPQPQGFEVPMVGLDYVCDGRPGMVMVAPLGRHGLAPGVALGLAAAAAPSRRVLVVDADGGDALLVAAAGAAPPAQRLDQDGEGGSLDRFVSVAALPGAPDGVHVDLAVLDRGTAGPQAAARRRLASLAGAYDLVLLCVGHLGDDPVAYALLRDVATVVLVVDRRGGGAGTRRLPEVRRSLSLAGRTISGVVVARTRRVRGTTSRTEEPDPPSRPAVPDVRVHTR